MLCNDGEITEIKANGIAKEPPQLEYGSRESVDKSPTMDDFWKRAKAFADEAAKQSQTLTSSSNKIADLVAETAKKSKELAVEASKKADQIKIAALKQADQIQQIKSFSDIIPPQLSSLSIAAGASSSSSTPEISDSELRKFGLTDDLRDFVKGFTSSTFQNFPIQEESETSDVPTTASNVRKDLTEWQERHATLVLTTVKEISRLRYELCPRTMKERKFWRIYFTLVSIHVAQYEKEYMEEVKRKAEEQMQADKMKKAPSAGESEAMEKNPKNKTSADQDLDTFLLGDLEDSDGGPDDGDGDGDGSFDDDFDKIESSDVEDEKHSKKVSTAAG